MTAKTIRSRRQALGLTIRGLESLCGVADSTICRLETGRTKKPEAWTRRTIEGALRYAEDTPILWAIEMPLRPVDSQPCAVFTPEMDAIVADLRKLSELDRRQIACMARTLAGEAESRGRLWPKYGMRGE